MRLTFPAVAVGRDKAVVEHRIISLDKGSNFNRCELWYDGLSRETNVAAGVVVHKADTESLVLAADKVLYADPTDRPDKLGTQVFVGILFPDGHADSRLMPSGEGGDIVGNAIGIVPYKSVGISFTTSGRYGRLRCAHIRRVAGARREPSRILTSSL